MMRSPAAAAKRRRVARTEETSGGASEREATDPATRVTQGDGDDRGRAEVVETSERETTGVSGVNVSDVSATESPGAALTMPVAVGVDAAVGGRQERLLPRQAKKKQRLVEKAK